MTFAETWASVGDIDGWLTEGQARLLYETASTVGDSSTIVEIGSHHGRSTVILGRAKPQTTKFVAVDPFGDPRWGGGGDALSVFQSNLERHGLSGEVTHIRSFGAEAGRNWTGGPVEMLFVDGAHDYSTVLADLRAWMPHLGADATVLMHDAYSSPGVTRAAFQQFFGSREFEFERCSRSLVLFRRHAMTADRRFSSGARMLGRMPWLARNLAIKLAIREGWNVVPPLLGHRDEALPY